MNNAVETKPARHTPLQLQFALALYCSSYPIDVLGEMYDKRAVLMGLRAVKAADI